jgi:hypothetical protein
MAIYRQSNCDWILESVSSETEKQQDEPQQCHETAQHHGFPLLPVISLRTQDQRKHRQHHPNQRNHESTFCGTNIDGTNQIRKPIGANITVRHALWFTAIDAGLKLFAELELIY